MAVEREEEYSLQDVHPETLLLATELLSNLSSLQMPFNVQNVIGNWLQLIGQIILVFNAQQQLWQEGPGSCYSRCRKAGVGDGTQDGAARCETELQMLRQEVQALRRQVMVLEGRLERR